MTSASKMNIQEKEMKVRKCCFYCLFCFFPNIKNLFFSKMSFDTKCSLKFKCTTPVYFVRFFFFPDIIFVCYKMKICFCLFRVLQQSPYQFNKNAKRTSVLTLIILLTQFIFITQNVDSIHPLLCIHLLRTLSWRETWVDIALCHFSLKELYSIQHKIFSSLHHQN